MVKNNFFTSDTAHWYSSALEGSPQDTETGGDKELEATVQEVEGSRVSRHWTQGPERHLLSVIP